VDAEPLLQLDHQVEEDPVTALGVGDQARHLPEVRLLLPRRRPSAVESTAPIPLGENPETTLSEELVRIVLQPLTVLGALDEDMRGLRKRDQGRAKGRGAVRTSSAQILRGMVEQQPAAVSSPSTLPARCSIFWRASIACSIGARLGVASLRADA